ncbi:MAG: hypothetical protein ABMA64_01200 [Myxococcota bacterium]
MWTLLCSAALAVSPAWLRDGADLVTIDAGQVDAALYRGPTTRYLPAIETSVTVGGAVRPALAVVDVAGSWSRVSPEVAATLGLEVEFTRLQGEWTQIASIDALKVGELTITGLHLQVDPRAPGLVLGLSTLPELAVALLPSESVVRFVPAKQGPALVASVGTPIAVTRQPARGFRTAAGTLRGDGLTLRVPGALRWGEAQVPGTVHVRTDLPVSRVAPSTRLPDPVVRAGVPYHDVGTQLGEVRLADTWIEQDPGIGDPAPDFAAALGYDVLFSLDLAVSAADGIVAFRRAPEVGWENATPVSIAFARERYAQEEARAKATGDVTVGPTDPKVEISFDGPKRASIPLGDPGNPSVRDRNLDLAETLWWGGDLDAAIPYYLAASRYAGDHCSAHLLLGERRLAWAGVQLLDSVVGRLVIDPIERAGTLWDTWLALDEAERAAIAEGRGGPKGSLQVYQPEDCRVAYGLLAAVQRARGDTEAVNALEGAHLAAHPAIAYSRALVALSDGRFGSADPLLSVANSMAAVEPVDLQVAVAKAKAGQAQVEAVEAIASELPGYPSDHPLTVALGLLEAAELTARPELVVRRAVRADDRWVPGQLAFALASHTAPPPWDDTVELQSPGSPQIACQKAVWLALSGKPHEARYVLKLEKWPGFADWWTASAVVAWAQGDEVGMKTALNNLTLRFPLLPVEDLGLDITEAPAVAP